MYYFGHLLCVIQNAIGNSVFVFYALASGDTALAECLFPDIAFFQRRFLSRKEQLSRS